MEFHCTGYGPNFDSLPWKTAKPLVELHPKPVGGVRALSERPVHEDHALGELVRQILNHEFAVTTLANPICTPFSCSV